MPKLPATWLGKSDYELKVLFNKGRITRNQLIEGMAENERARITQSNYRVIGVVGSRRRATEEDMQLTIDTFFEYYSKGDRIVSGGCELGADRFAEVIASDHGITITIHYPRQEDLDKALLAHNPRAAWAKINYARNTLIAEDCHILIALVAPDRLGGTEDTIRKAIKLGKEVIYA